MIFWPHRSRERTPNLLSLDKGWIRVLASVITGLSTIGRMSESMGMGDDFYSSFLDVKEEESI